MWHSCRAQNYRFCMQINFHYRLCQRSTHTFKPTMDELIDYWHGVHLKGSRKNRVDWIASYNLKLVWIDTKSTQYQLYLIVQYDSEIPDNRSHQTYCNAFSMFVDASCFCRWIAEYSRLHCYTVIHHSPQESQELLFEKIQKEISYLLIEKIICNNASKRKSMEKHELHLQ